MDEQLAQKGLTKVEKNADLQVIYHSAVHQEMGIDLSGTALGGREYGSCGTVHFKAGPPPFQSGRWLWTCMTLHASN